MTTEHEIYSGDFFKIIEAKRNTEKLNFLFLVPFSFIQIFLATQKTFSTYKLSPRFFSKHIFIFIYTYTINLFHTKSKSIRSFLPMCIFPNHLSWLRKNLHHFQTKSIKALTDVILVSLDTNENTSYFKLKHTHATFQY